MKQILNPILLVVIFLFSISCAIKDKKDVKENNSSYTGDPMERSALSKANLPWFARFQVGDPPVIGFPGETEIEKKQRMQAWMDAKYGLFIHWGPQSSGGEYALTSEKLQEFNPVGFNAEEWVLTAQKLGFNTL